MTSLISEFFLRHFCNLAINFNFQLACPRLHLCVILHVSAVKDAVWTCHLGVFTPLFSKTSRWQ